MAMLSALAGLRSRGLLVPVITGLLCAAAPVYAQSEEDQNPDGFAQFEFAGRAAAWHRVEITPQTLGVVTDSVATIGMAVKQGDLLIQIDPKPYQYVLNRAQAKLDNARVRLEAVTKELKKQKELLEKKLTTATKVYGLVAAYNLAQGAVAEANAEVQSATYNLSSTEVRSPIDGIVSEINVEPGETVGRPNDNNAKLVVLKYHPINVIIEIDPEDHLKLRKRQLKGAAPASDIVLEFADGEVYPHRGKYVGSFHQLNEKTGKIGHVVTFPNPDLLIVPGLPVKIVAKFLRSSQ